MPSGQSCLEVFARRAAAIQARKLIQRESRRHRNIPARSCATAHRDHSKIASPRQTLKVVHRMLRMNGWRSLVNCHPVKSEMPVAAPKSQAKGLIQLDIILVCRKQTADVRKTTDASAAFQRAVERATSKARRLKSSGFTLSVQRSPRHPDEPIPRRNLRRTQFSVMRKSGIFHCSAIRCASVRSPVGFGFRNECAETKARIPNVLPSPPRTETTFRKANVL